jgi:hypothetical protein
MRLNTTDQVWRSNAQTKLERLPMMVKGIMGNDLVVQIECTAQFLGLLGREKNPPIQTVIDAGPTWI